MLHAKKKSSPLGELFDDQQRVKHLKHISAL